MSAADAVSHPFFKIKRNEYKDLSKQMVQDVFMNCRHFKPQYLFQVEVLRHMVGRFLPHAEKAFLRKVFDALDVEKDGELEPKEFVEQFYFKFNLQLGIKDMQRMINSMDLEGTKTGGDGLIQYSEFLVAACNKQSLLEGSNINKEFKYLDHDKDGVLDVSDIERFMYGLTGKGEYREDKTDFT